MTCLERRLTTTLLECTYASLDALGHEASIKALIREGGYDVLGREGGHDIPGERDAPCP